MASISSDHFLIGFYFEFIKYYQVKNFDLVGVCLKGTEFTIETRESAKYIVSHVVVKNDTLDLFPMTTTIFNPFCQKHSSVKISVDPNIRYFQICGKTISRNKVPSCNNAID